mmetsp:Transcript_2893/g.11708  ORF Transcript_2893/g.11708 Transcript_2893/m.11708 type:complete len:257 (+) Transcript_2893:953-1723(+)
MPAAPSSDDLPPLLRLAVSAEASPSADPAPPLPVPDTTLLAKGVAAALAASSADRGALGAGRSVPDAAAGSCRAALAPRSVLRCLPASRPARRLDGAAPRSCGAALELGPAASVARPERGSGATAWRLTWMSGSPSADADADATPPERLEVGATDPARPLQVNLPALADRAWNSRPKHPTVGLRRASLSSVVRRSPRGSSAHGRTNIGCSLLMRLPRPVSSMKPVTNGSMSGTESAESHESCSARLSGLLARLWSA